MKYDESPQRTRSQPWKSMKVHGNLWKTKKIYEIRWKSSEDKKPARNRAKVSIGTASRISSFLNIPRPRNPWKSLKIYGIHEKLWFFFENLRSTMRILRGQDKNPAWNRAKVFIGAAGRTLPFLRIHAPKSMRIHKKIHENLWNPWKPMKIFENLCNTMKVLRGQEASPESSKGV